MEITTQQIFEAYKKFKNYCYYDNTSMFTRQVIAEFEKKFFDEKNISKDFRSIFMNNDHIVRIKQVINDGEDRVLNMLLDKVDCKLIPKSPKENEYSSKIENDIRFITNVKDPTKAIDVASVNALIDAPIEIHLISVLWLMIVGIKYANAIGSNCYANLFELNASDTDEQKISKGYHLYKPYYEGYQKWRDNALKEAERLLAEKQNATIVSLDIKRFYYSVRVNLEELLATVNNKNNIDDNDNISIRLTKVLQRVHERYHQKVRKFIEEARTKGNVDDSVSHSVLPVGLLSSGFIANLYLSEFDYQVTQRLKPSYYGRYVDDMLFVFSDITLDKPQNFIKNTFINFKILNKVNEQKQENCCLYKIVDYNNYHYDDLTIQNNKIVIEHFDHNETRAALKKFIKNLNKNRSEFRYIPDEEEIENDFEDSAFNLQYTDSVNKFRSIKDFAEDKYGASSYLAHKIFLSCYTTTSKDKNDKEGRKQILQFFTGKTSIFFYSLWAKVVTYFFLNKDKEGLRLFIEEITDSINKINFATSQSKNVQSSKKKLEADLNEYLINSIASSLAINPDFEFASRKFDAKAIIEKAKERSKLFRHSNLFSHNLLRLSAIPSTDLLLNDKANLLDLDMGNCILFSDNEAIKYLFPRYLHYEEVSIIKIYRALSSANTTNDQINIELTKLNSDINEQYNSFNRNWHHLFEDHDQSALKKDTVGFAKIHVDGRRRYITVEDDYNKNHFRRKKLKIAIANIKVDQYVISKMAQGKQDLTCQRKNDLFSIINAAIKEKVELLVLPELAVPFQWLSLLAQRCRKSNLAIVTGLTYFCNSKGYAFNTVATLLPMTLNGYNSCFVSLRLKNHYSPKELSTLQGFRFKCPQMVNNVYNLYHWRNLYFTVYNCFELASIEDRSLFKSQVDLMIATELNRDTNYFSEIAGAWVRDIHAFFVQVNTSEFGNSCIMKPSSKNTRELVKVTGGENSIILIKELDVAGLRDFEFKGYNLQDLDKTYKMTPPDYKHSNALSRMNDEDMYTNKDN